MLLFGKAGTYVQINLILLASIVVFALHMYFVIKYIVKIYYYDNVKAEKYIAYAGYFGVAAMVLQFIFGTVALENDVVELEHSYIGLVVGLGAIFVIPFLVIADLKQQKWIKNLSIADQKKYNISLKDRMPLIIVIAALVVISFALFGFVIEGYCYIMDGLR
ncbi:MAG: hypothetical protein K6G48_04795 [Acholeplasmatales bacterium]|nr:hypothetical protein [Acholeplasmatales bacterium]